MSDLGIEPAAFAALQPELEARQALDVVRRAAELGYRACWTPEASALEAFALLSACGAAAPELDLGTAIAPIEVRSPLLAAMGAVTLQALHPDRRIVLGVGISSPVVTARRHGVPYGDHPVARMREYLTVVRALLGGEQVSHEGANYQLSGSQLGIRLDELRLSSPPTPRSIRACSAWLARRPTACCSTICRPATYLLARLKCAEAKRPQEGRPARVVSTPASTSASPPARMRLFYRGRQDLWLPLTAGSATSCVERNSKPGRLHSGGLRSARPQSDGCGCKRSHGRRHQLRRHRLGRV